MKRLFLALLLIAQPTYAALPAGAVINIMSTATAGNLNGGGFNSARGGTNYSLQDAAQVNGTDGTSNATTNFNSAAVTFTSQMVGNYLHLTAGTNGTAGWYEITAFVDANNVTLDRNCSTGAMTNGTFYVGGALSLGSADDAVFEIGVAGNIFYVKGGATYTMGGAIGISAAGTALNPIILQGYTTTQGDACSGSSRPTLATGINNWNFGAAWNANNIIFTTGGATGINQGANSIFVNAKAVNNSTTAGRIAFTVAGGGMLRDCEAVSYRGTAVAGPNSAHLIVGCWLHDSDVGYSQPNTATIGVIADTIFSSNVTAAFRLQGAATSQVTLINNTLFGSSSTTGVGVSLATGVSAVRLINNIITGFVTGVSHADAQTFSTDVFNNYYNNDTDVTNWVKSANATAVNPSFTSVGQVTGTTATTAATNRLIQSGATFQTSGVTAGRDYVYIVSGTGVTAGIYGILSVDSETQITTDITLAANATADKVFQITTGQNFAVGTAMKALGFPGAFQGGYTTGYMDQGAVQRQEPAGGGGQTSSASAH